MTIKICDGCQTRYMFSPENTDYVHDCSVAVNTTLRDEDVTVVGPWTDYTGSGGVSTTQAMLQGTVNQLAGTRAGLEGADFDGVTARGNRETTHRSRTKLQYKDLRRIKDGN